MKKLMVLLCCLLLVACSSNETKKEEAKPKKEKQDEIVSASFLAVGDNLIHDTVYMAGAKNDGTYDFDRYYENTNYLTQNVDVAYLNQETICGGNELGLSNYPAFNGPYEILDAVHNAGFDWISAASNHSFDRGEQGIINQLNYIRQYDDIVMSGIHDSKEDASKLQVIERNGMKIGLLAYTYGLNGYTIPEGKEYLVDLIDKDKIAEDMKALKKISDVQAISMHWGVEYQFSPNQEQQELAQYLSDLGVDVIIGAHPHVIQPMDYVEGKEGNTTLVIYSMGNFLSAQNQNDNMLGGMPMWEMEYNKNTKEVAFKNVKFLPTVTYIGGNMSDYRTYALKDYTNDIASSHFVSVYMGQDTSREYYIQRVHEIMNDKIEIVY